MTMTTELCLFHETDVKRFDLITDAVFHLTRQENLLSADQSLSAHREPATGKCAIGMSNHFTPGHTNEVSRFVEGVVEGMLYALDHQQLESETFSGSKLKNEGLACFKIKESGKLWADTVVYTEQHMASDIQADQYARALSVINKGKEVRWNWRGFPVGHYVGVAIVP